MYIDYCLKFPDQSAADAVLNETIEAVVDGAGQIITEASVLPRYPHIDVIGVIFKPTGDHDSRGLPIMAPIDGYHVNVRTTEPAPELDMFSVAPTNPVRVWG